MNTYLLALPLVSVLGLVACDRAPSPPEAAKEASAAATKATPAPAAAGGFDRPFAAIEIEVSAAAKTKAEAMLARVADGVLHDDDRAAGDPEALAWIAATATNPKVVGDAIVALAITEKTPPPAAATVIVARLHCSDPDVLQGVADALRYMTEQAGLVADKTVVDAIVDAAQHHPNELVRSRALASLWSLPKERAEHQIAVRGLDAASPPARLWIVLEAMSTDRDDPLRSEIVERLVTLSAHADPSVRGVAARRLGAIEDGDPARMRLLALLADKQPFVRCQALEGLGFLRRSHKVLVAPVAALLDDAAACNQSIEGPTIGGTETIQIGSALPVSVRAALALESLSIETNERLTIGPVQTADPAGMATQIAAAKAWAQRRG